MRRMHDILEENGSVKSIDGLPVGLEVKSYNGSTNSFDFMAEEGKSYLFFGIGKTSDQEDFGYESDVMYIYNYSTQRTYDSANGKISIHIGDPLVYYNGFEAVHCVVIPL